MYDRFTITNFGLLAPRTSPDQASAPTRKISTHRGRRIESISTSQKVLTFFRSLFSCSAKPASPASARPRLSLSVEHVPGPASPSPANPTATKAQLPDTKREPAQSYDACENRIQILCKAQITSSTNALHDKSRRKPGGKRHTERVRDIDAKLKLWKDDLSEKIAAMQKMVSKEFTDCCNEIFHTLDQESSIEERYVKASQATCGEFLSNGLLTSTQKKSIDSILTLMFPPEPVDSALHTSTPNDV